MLSRNESVVSKIKIKYANQSAKTMYSEVGKTNYYFSFWIAYQCKPTCTSYAINAEKVLQTFSEPSNILEIGCGGGQFLHTHHGGNRAVYGLSLKDDCIPDKKFVYEQNELKTVPILKHENHYFGNAEDIDFLESINQRKYSLIFSKYTFIHFLDPLGSLQRAYALLEEGGILMVDIMFLNGLSDPMPLLWSLHLQGYEFITAITDTPNTVIPLNQAKVYSTLSCFYIRKTKPVLDLPLNYIEMESMGTSAKQTLGYCLDESIRQIQVDYEDPEFILKISDNEWVQAYAIQKVLNLDPQQVTNNPKFSADVGKKMLNDTLGKIAIPQLLSQSHNPVLLYVSQKLRAADSAEDLRLLGMHFCKTLDCFNTADPYGFKPIHLVVRLDNLELFKFFINKYPQLLQEKTANNNEMTPMELAAFYHTNTNESKIYDYLVDRENKLSAEKQTVTNSIATQLPFFNNFDEVSSGDVEELGITKKLNG